MALVSAGIPEVLNILIPVKYVEHIINIPTAAKKIMLQIRTGGDLKIAFNPGESFTKYFTLRGFNTYFEDFIMGPFTLAIQSETDNTVIELVIWKHYD